MALLPPVFQQSSEYSARVVRQFIAALATEGVVGSGLAVSERGDGANMSVDVSPGQAYIEGDDSPYQGMYLCASDAVENLVVQPSDPSVDRIDLVVARVNDIDAGAPSGTDWELQVIEGTPGSPPSAPAVPDTAISLAEVYIDAGSTSVTDSDITPTATAASSTIAASLLDGLRDVTITSAAANDALVYTASGWVNRPASRIVQRQVKEVSTTPTALTAEGTLITSDNFTPKFSTSTLWVSYYAPIFADSGSDNIRYFSLSLTTSANVGLTGAQKHLYGVRSHRAMRVLASGIGYVAAGSTSARQYLLRGNPEGVSGDGFDSIQLEGATNTAFLIIEEHAA